MKQNKYYVYILASMRNGTIYIGVTGNILERISLHKSEKIKGFTQKYSVTTLVYYESFDYINDALSREKQLKKWNRKWKINLIEKVNPLWEDITESIWNSKNLVQ
jgi:putative endonuclease